MIGYDIFRILEKRTSSMIACVSACLTNLTHTDIHRHTQTHTQTHTHTDTHTQTHTDTHTHRHTFTDTHAHTRAREYIHVRVKVGRPSWAKIHNDFQNLDDTLCYGGERGGKF